MNYEQMKGVFTNLKGIKKVVKMKSFIKYKIKKCKINGFYDKKV